MTTRGFPVTDAQRSVRTLAHMGRLKAYGSAAGAFLVASAVGVGMGSLGSGDAVAQEGSPVSGETTEATSSTPDSLRANAGAQDYARYLAFEKEYEGVVYTCETPAGANSLSSAFMVEADQLIDPMAEGTYRISSGFGWRIDPFTYMTRMHEGVDYAASIGTPIYAVAKGTVVYAGPGEFGRTDNLVVIEHEVNGEVFTTWHNHSYLDGIYVSTGDEVQAGDHISDVGNAGRSTGPHLHFEIHPGPFTGDWEDNAVDPIAFLTDRGAVDVTELCN